jgi:type III pantothenate kinase
MTLLVDIGNTRIKWARLTGTVLGEQSAAPHATWTADTFVESILNSGARAGRVLIGNVGGARMADVARQALSKTWSIEPEFVQSTSAAGGIRNSYPEPAKLGVDRWLAMIGARSLDPAPACIVSVGTAMTIDGLDASGRHLGGAIVPGPELMVSSLLKNTSEIAQRAQQGTTADRLFADNTLGAIHQGAEHALAALVERAVLEIEGALAQSPNLLLTGGAVDRVAKSVRWPHQVIPELVLRGLAVLAAEHKAPRVSSAASPE